MYIMNPDTGNVELPLVECVIEEYQIAAKRDRYLGLRLRRALETVARTNRQTLRAIVEKLETLPDDSLYALPYVLTSRHAEATFGFVEMLAKLEVPGAEGLEGLFNAFWAADESVVALIDRIGR